MRFALISGYFNFELLKLARFELYFYIFSLPSFDHVRLQHVIHSQTRVIYIEIIRVGKYNINTNPCLLEQNSLAHTPKQESEDGHC